MTSSSGPGNNVSRAPGYDLQPGQVVLNTWEVLEPLGRGGMGAVYRVYHRFLQKEMAMKTLRPDQVTDVNWKRFQTEAKAIAKLVHPNIIQIFDMGTCEEGQPFYTMELLDGQGLDEWIRYEPITAAQALTVFRQVATALAFAHERGIIHRDIKPANIVLTFAEANKPPVVKVVDFGIAKLGTENQGLTKEGEVFGSPLYMSPEQATGQKVDHRSDIYSFGCALYETLTGFPPFKGKSAMETMMMHLEKTPLPIERARPEMKFPPGLSAIVQMMLAKDPDERYSSAAQIAQDLMQIERGLGDKVAYRLQTASQMVRENAELDGEQVTQRLTSAYGRAEREELEEEELEEGPGEGEEAEKRLRVRPTFIVSGILGLAILVAVVCWVSRAPKPEVQSQNVVVTEEDIFRTSPSFRIFERQVRSLGKKYNGNYRYYVFPKDSVGRITIVDMPKPIIVEASGFIQIPNSRLHFQSSIYLLKNSQLWNKFLADDFYQFSFPAPPENIVSRVDKGLKASEICNDGIEFLRNHLKDIKGLDLSNVRPTDEQCITLGRLFPSLEALKFQVDLVVKSESLNGLLASTELRDLALPDVDVTVILQKLSLSDKLTSLRISNSKLTSRDFAYIGRLSNLIDLACINSEIPSHCIEHLKKLKHLKQIILTGTWCAADNVKAISELPVLHELVVANGNPWSKSDMDLLVHKLGANGVKMAGSVNERLGHTTNIGTTIDSYRNSQEGKEFVHEIEQRGLPSGIFSSDFEQ